MVTPWDTNGDEELSYDEAAAITDIGQVFNMAGNSYNLSNMDDLKYFKGITNIPNYAFYWDLNSVTIPESVTTIGDEALSAWNLTSIKVVEENQSFVVKSNVLYTKDEKTLVRALRSETEGAFEIPSTVTTIGGFAFRSSNLMSSVSIPNSVTSIGNSAFYSCSSLTAVDIPTSVTSVGEWAFAYTGLTSVSIPSSIIRLNSGIFAGCQNLTSVEIPATITSVGDNIFVGCDNLKDIYLPETEKAIELDEDALVINSDPDNLIIATIHTPMALLDDYALNPVLKQNFEAGKVVAKVTPVNKYFTFSSGVDVVLPEGVDAYKAMIVSDTQVGINKLTDTELNVGDQRIVKANNGVLLLGTAGKAYDIVAVSGTKVSGDDIVTTDAKSYGDDNQLEPVIVSAQFDAASYYVLSNNQFVAIDATSENKVPACKAVLKKPAGVAATRSLTIGDGNTTGITETVNEVENNTWYNLQGSRVQTPTKKGLYIKNHRKLMVK